MVGADHRPQEITRPQAQPLTAPFCPKTAYLSPSTRYYRLGTRSPPELRWHLKKRASPERRKIVRQLYAPVRELAVSAWRLSLLPGFEASAVEVALASEMGSFQRSLLNT